MIFRHTINIDINFYLDFGTASIKTKETCMG